MIGSIAKASWISRLLLASVVALSLAGCLEESPEDDARARLNKAMQSSFLAEYYAPLGSEPDERGMATSDAQASNRIKLYQRAVEPKEISGTSVVFTPETAYYLAHPKHGVVGGIVVAMRFENEYSEHLYGLFDGFAEEISQIVDTVPEKTLQHEGRLDFSDGKTSKEPLFSCLLRTAVRGNPKGYSDAVKASVRDVANSVNQKALDNRGAGAAQCASGPQSECHMHVNWHIGRNLLNKKSNITVNINFLPLTLEEGLVIFYYHDVSKLSETEFSDYLARLMPLLDPAHIGAPPQS